MKFTRNTMLKSRIIFVFALVLSLVLVTVFHQLSGLKAELDTQKNMTQTLEPKIEQSKKVLRRIENNDVSLSLMNEDLINLMARLSNKNQVSSILAKIRHLGSIQHVDIQSFILDEELSDSFYSKLPMHLALTGEYHALIQFLNGLQQLEHLIEFDKVALETNTNATSKSLTLSLAATLLMSNDSVKIASSNTVLPVYMSHQSVVSTLRNPFEPRTRHVIAANKLSLDTTGLEEKNQIFLKGNHWSVWVD